MNTRTSAVNRTGVADKPESLQAMTDAVLRLSPPAAVVDTSDAQSDRLLSLQQASPVGTLPQPEALSGSATAAMAQLLDKMGERIAFERTGVRLYDALIVKYHACTEAIKELSPITLALEEAYEAPDVVGISADDSPAKTLERIRAEELEHLHMLCEAMQQLGGDPSAQTPSADVMAMASSGLLQVMSDPRTTLSQSINAMLTAELTDNVGWELLLELANKADQAQLSDRFLHALAQEGQHLSVLRGWTAALLATEHPCTTV